MKEKKKVDWLSAKSSGSPAKVPPCTFRNKRPTWEEAVAASLWGPFGVLNSSFLWLMGSADVIVSGGAETDVGELYSVSTLAEMCLLWREESLRTRNLPPPPPPSHSRPCQFIFYLHHQGRWFDKLPLACLHLQDTKQHHVWLVSEFNGLERGVLYQLLLRRYPLSVWQRLLRRQENRGLL